MAARLMPRWWDMTQRTLSPPRPEVREGVKSTASQRPKRPVKDVYKRQDNLFKHLYEDNVTGKLSDERFIKMSHDYELEQSNLKAMAEVLREEIKQQEKQKTNVKAFISAVKKYTDMQHV